MDRRERALALSPSVLSPRRSDSIRAATQIRQSAVTLEKARDKILDTIKPPTLPGKIRRVAVRRISGFLPRPVRERLEETPANTLKGELRQAIFGIYGDMKDLLTEGRERTEFHQEIELLIQIAEEDQDDMQAVDELRQRLREKAETELDLRRDPETESLLEEMRKVATPQQAAENRQTVLAEAKQFHQLSEPIIRTIETVVLQAVKTFESLNARYAAIAEYSGALNLLNRTSRDLMRGAELGILSPDTIIKELELAIGTARAAMEAQAIAKELDQTVNPNRLREISRQAHELNQLSVGNKLVQPSALPEKTL